MKSAFGLACILVSLVLTIDARAAELSWSDLKLMPGPVAVVPSSDLSGMRVATVPTAVRGMATIDDNRLAYCGLGAIWRTLDGGLSWSQIPVGPVSAASGPLPLAPHVDGTPVCRSVVLDPGYPDTFYAVFQAARPPESGPPWYAAGFYTLDAGQTWQPAPAPDGADASQFGGFEAHGDGVEALWQPASTPSPGDQVAPPRVMVTNNGAANWHSAAFACPAVGPCIRWGVLPTGVGSCSDHPYVQPLLISADSGQTWSAPVGANAVDACSPSQLVMLTNTDVLLLAPGSTEVEPSGAPARVSGDGGRTFVPLALPPGLPDARPRQLTLLLDGRLLALTGDGDPAWHLANPGSVYWCGVISSVLPLTPTALSTHADSVVWLAGPGAPKSMPATDLACSGPVTVPSWIPISPPRPTFGPR